MSGNKLNELIELVGCNYKIIQRLLNKLHCALIDKGAFPTLQELQYMNDYGVTYIEKVKIFMCELKCNGDAYPPEDIQKYIDLDAAHCVKTREFVEKVI
jgi:hypothetical protein